MRIGTKLLLTYLLLVGMVAAASVTALPPWVEHVVVKQEQSRLEAQVQGLARQLTPRLKNLRPGDPSGVRQTLRLAENVVTAELIAVVDENGRVLDSSAPELRGTQMDLAGFTAKVQGGEPFQVDGVGPALGAIAPLQTPLHSASVLMLRDITYVQELAQGVNRRISIGVLVLLGASLLVAGLVSRELVARLKETGEAARALAEGDLARRVPERGRDEITELAGHFNNMAERIQALVEGLRRSEQARKVMLAAASHEIRTPLTSIGGFAEALRDGLVQEEAQRQRYYEIIAANSARLNRLVDDLFDVARLEAGQAELTLQAMQVGPWLEEFVQLYPSDGQSPRLVLSLEPAAATTEIYGDRDRLAQVLQNLVANALRYSPEDGQVEIRARLVGDDLEVAVADQGPGLTPDEAEQVFQRFYQGPNQGRGHKGAGLGLAIVQTLVEAHGGQVGVESEPGLGARFWFRLKRVAK